MEYIAISTFKLSFIVRAGTLEELNRRLDSIKKKYPKFTRKYLEPGYYIVQANSIAEAKSKLKSQEQHYEVKCPLFRSSGKAS